MSRSLRVVHVTPSFHPAYVYGGPTHSLYHLTRALAAHGHDVRVLTTNANGRDQVLDVDTRAEVELERGLRVRYTPRLGHTMSPTLVRLLSAYVSWADVVHLTAVYSFPTLPTLVACRLRKRPLVWSPRGALQRWSGTRRRGVKHLWEMACRISVPHRTVLHVTSQSEAEQTRHRVPGVRTALVPNCLELPPSPAHVPSSGELRLLFLGRIDPIKGLENLLDACAQLVARGSRDFRLTLGGTGDAAYVAFLQARAEQLGLGERVRFIGWVSSAHKAQVFSEADALVLPSHTENFGIVVAEALAHGVPVIAGQGTPWAALVEHDLGLWVPNDAESLADAIRQLGAVDRAALGARGRRWAAAHLSSTVVARSMTEVYEELCGVRAR